MGPAVSRRWWPRPLLVSAVVSLILNAGVVAAQTPASLRIVHNIDKPGPTHAEVSGRVYNDGTADVLDVYVNVAAVDGAGKVLAQGISFVGAVPVRGSTAFKARVPVVAGTTSYRVGINSFRFGIGRESP
jgi:hypothetical protein